MGANRTDKVTDGTWSLLLENVGAPDKLFHLSSDPQQNSNRFTTDIDHALRLYDGFIDYASGISGVGPANLNFTSQLKLDLAPYFNLDSPLYIGVEYVYWRNKFYIDGVNEHNPNLLVKWHF